MKEKNEVMPLECFLFYSRSAQNEYTFFRILQLPCLLKNFHGCFKATAHHYAYNITGSYEDARDVVQDVYLEVMKKLKTYRK